MQVLDFYMFTRVKTEKFACITTNKNILSIPRTNLVKSNLVCPSGGMVDAADLKSVSPSECGFKSHLGHSFALLMVI